MGCGSDGGGGAVDPWTYPEHQYKITTVNFSDPGLDINGDGTKDNNLPELFTMLSTFLSGDINAEMNTAITNGSSNILFSIYSKDMQNSDKAMLWTFLGGNKGTDPTTVDTTNGPANAYFSGSIVNSQANFGGATTDFTFTLVLLVNTTTITLQMPIKSATYQLAVSFDNKLQGVLGGYITKDDVKLSIDNVLHDLGLDNYKPIVDSLLNNSALYDLTMNGSDAMSFAMGFDADVVTTPYTHPDPPK
jgi:hypothetical protein